MKNKIIAAVALGAVATLLAAEETAPTSVSFEDGTVMASLTGVPGDPVAGRAAFINRKQGNCLACHMNAEIPEQSFHGEVGPPLDGVADRLSQEELRAIVTNAKMVFEGTIMPAFYIDSGYNRPLEKFDGETILTAQQVEDIVAYLLTLSY